jgi:Putative zinc-finger
MTDMCTTLMNRDELLVAYLYDDIDAASRAAFEAHMTSCVVCREEVHALQRVRHDLAQWTPPERRTSIVDPRTTNLEPRTSDERRTANDEPRTAWMQLPAWAQVAAALLFFGVAAGLANVNVHYDSSGLTVRTGWIKTPPPAANVQRSSAQSDTATRAEFVALEQRLRGEMRALQTTAHAVDTAQPPRGSADADLLRRVRALVDESEKRQQTELALRIGEVLRDVNARRQADLVKIDHSLDWMQNNLGVEVLKQRERVNYLMRANQTVPVR